MQELLSRYSPVVTEFVNAVTTNEFTVADPSDVESVGRVVNRLQEFKASLDNYESELFKSAWGQ